MVWMKALKAGARFVGARQQSKSALLSSLDEGESILLSGEAQLRREMANGLFAVTSRGFRFEKALTMTGQTTSGSLFISYGEIEGLSEVSRAGLGGQFTVKCSNGESVVLAFSSRSRANEVLDATWAAKGANG